MNGIETAVGDNVGQIVRRIVTWAQDNGFRIRPTSKNLYVGVQNKNGELVEPFAFDTDGKLWGQFGQLRAPFDSLERRRTVREKLSSIPGVEFSKADQFPTAPMSRLTPISISGFEKFLSWIRQEVNVRQQTESTARETETVEPIGSDPATRTRLGRPAC